MIGKYVGDYQITEQLGEGGMGIVFKGIHPTLGQIVAVKMLHPNLIKADSIKQRFLREAQAMARLRHQNILQLYNFIESDDGCFIIMEYVEGETLEDVLERQRVLPAQKAIEMFLPILRAMHFAHQNDIIHRDIKPSNIMVLKSGILKVMDFGTAKMEGGPQLTAAGMTLGTVVYMSPEQLMGRDLSPQADIYSLGVTLYELVTGQLPFYHENEMQLMKLIMKSPAPPPTTHFPSLPKALEAVILKSLEKDRTCRHSTAEEFAQDLERLQAELWGVGSSSGAYAPQPSAPALAAPPPSPSRPEIDQPGDTQQVRPAPATQSSFAAGGLNTLALVGIILTCLGAVLMGLLMALGNPMAGAVSGGVLVLLGAVLLIVGLTAKGAGAPGALPAGRPSQVAAPPQATPPTKKTLEVIEGPESGRSHDLNESSITVGRAPDNDMTLQDPSVSSHHARIDFHDGNYFLSDLDSSNGTYVNNNRVKQSPLKDKDLIALGSCRLIVNL
jgi:serine/threonine-protein kinase